MILGWEDAQHAVYSIGAIEELDSTPDGYSSFGSTRYVAVRCSVVSGACERIPHPVDALAEVR